MCYHLSSPERVIEIEKTFFPRCFYDADFGKVVHNSSKDAQEIYCTIQRMEIERFADGKALSDEIALEWIIRFAKSFRNLWEKTNEFCKD